MSPILSWPATEPAVLGKGQLIACRRGSGDERLYKRPAATARVIGYVAGLTSGGVNREANPWIADR